MHSDRGRLQIYTGDGKGKTTAAMGLALRASGAGWKIFFLQFLKGRRASEQRPLRRLTGLTLRSFGREGWVKKPRPGDIREAQRALAALARAVRSGRFDLVVADVICVAIRLGLIREAAVLELIRKRPAGVELLFTGRGASACLRREADLVTVMQPAKHYYARGVRARRGIEY